MNCLKFVHQQMSSAPPQPPLSSTYESVGHSLCEYMCNYMFWAMN